MTDAMILHEGPAAALSVAELRDWLSVVQATMRSVMVDGSDFGVIPGTNKPSLYKPGAEKLCLTFRLTAAEPVIEALEDYGGEIRYRVQVPIRSSSGRLLAVGVGECSSAEEKYKWRRPVHENEFLAAPEARRRVKFQRNGEAWHQVRVEPADVGNTVLKMAHKRAYVQAVIMATAAGSIFTQDVEDLPEGTIADEPRPPSVQTPIRKPRAEAPFAEREARAAPPVGKGAGVVVIKVVSVDIKTGMGAKGKWAKATIAASDGHTYGTFDTKHHDIAFRAKDNHEALEVQYAESKYGRDVTAMQFVGKLEEPAPAEGPATAPAEDEIPF